MSNEQSNAELHERVARRMAARHGYVLEDDDAVIYRPLADVALAALGLDDLDAAVERATDWLHESPWSQCNMGSDTCDTRPLARGVLLAVLAPPEDDRG